MTRLRFRILSIFIGALFVLGLAVAPANAATVTQATPQTTSSVRADGGGGYWGPGYGYGYRHHRPGYWGYRNYGPWGYYGNWGYNRCGWYGNCYGW